MTVIEIIQFNEHEIKGQNFEDFIKKIPTNSYSIKVRLIDESTETKPPIGDVWYIEGEDGLCKKYKANYDSSD